MTAETGVDRANNGHPCRQIGLPIQPIQLPVDKRLQLPRRTGIRRASGSAARENLVCLTIS